MEKAKRISFLVVFLLISFCWNHVNAQNAVRFADVKKAFHSFQYQKVIQLADTLVKQDALTESRKIEVLRMKAIAHYILKQDEKATLTFLQLLNLDPDYQLDPIENSPKIISFFEKIRQNYRPPTPIEKKTELESPEKKEPGQKLKTEERQSEKSKFKKTIARSLILPGWGQYTYGKQIRGAVMMGVSVATLSALVYYFDRTQELENAYLNAIEQSEIDRRYTQYNRAYQIRNGLLLFYALVWSYAQWDVLHLKNLSISPVYSNMNSNFTGLQLNYVF